MIKVVFIFDEIKIVMKCNIEKKMKELCILFSKKIGKDFQKLNFTYNNNNLNYELSLDQQANKIDKNKNKIIIYVKEKNDEIENKLISNNFICPKCGDNIRIDINDYKISLYECKNGHKMNNILLGEFESIYKIICSKCENIIINEYYKCFSCNNEAKTPVIISFKKMYKR